MQQGDGKEEHQPFPNGTLSATGRGNWERDKRQGGMQNLQEECQETS